MLVDLGSVDDWSHIQGQFFRPRPEAGYSIAER
jgi:hypothetical protein